MNLIHKHYPEITAVVIGTYNNGSLKVIKTDLSAPSAKLRRPKNDTIPTDCRDQWVEVK